MVKLNNMLGCYWDIVVGYEFRIKTDHAIEKFIQILCAALEILE